MSVSTKTKNIAVAFIIIGIVITALIWRVSRVKLEKKSKFRIKQTIDEMVAKCNAITDWDKSFVDYEKKVDDGHRSIYTIDIKEALVNDEHRPVLFYGYVSDVKKIKETYFAVFTMVENVDISFALKCNSEQIEKILNQPTKDYADSYAVFATISEIHRPEFEVDAYQDSEDGPYILVEPGDYYIANGICLDLSFVGDYDH
ncbi:MAG: hypothetical protein FVQ82_02700 [Planctomycetes bacterium]|nr:hypothetical protein [Planctomycetota bacterium]